MNLEDLYRNLLIKLIPFLQHKWNCIRRTDRIVDFGGPNQSGNMDCDCGLLNLLTETKQLARICSCGQDKVLEEIANKAYCKNCLIKTFPLQPGNYIEIDNLSGIVTECEFGSHFVIAINNNQERKQLFPWWKRYYATKVTAD